MNIPSRKEHLLTTSTGSTSKAPAISAEQQLLQSERKKLADKQKMKEENPDDYNKMREEQRREALKQALEDREFLKMPFLSGM